MRDFLAHNGAFDDIDADLLQSMNDSMQLELGGFVQLLITRSLSQADAINQFQMLSFDGQQVAAEECRVGLTMMAMDKFNAHFPEERMDAILNMVMMDAGPSVPL